MAKIMVAIEIEGVSYEKLREAMRMRASVQDVPGVMFHPGGKVEIDEDELKRDGDWFMFETIGVRP